MRQAVTVTTLDHLGPKAAEDAAERPYELREAAVACPELSRFLYVSVGGPWCWHLRLPWTYRQWLDHLRDPAVATWVGYQGGNPIGYFELHRGAAGAVEIAYFGLLPRYVGRGLGKRLLGDALAKADAFGDGRVWLHTCSLDHPAALPNYLARGFRVRRVDVVEEELPDAPLQPWPGAQVDLPRSWT